MCLYVNTAEHPDLKPHIAKADIPVYKVIGNDNFSAYLKFKYSRRKTYKLGHEFKLMGKSIPNVEEGFHAYISKTYADSRMLVGRKVVRFTIPKGAKYFIGLHEDVVSDQIHAGELRPLQSPSMYWY